MTLECLAGVIDALVSACTYTTKMWLRVHCTSSFPVLTPRLPAALYGTVEGACPSYEPSPTCNDAGFSAYAQAKCIGHQSSTLSSDGRPDPCLGVVKTIAVAAHCSLPPGGYSPDAPTPPPSDSGEPLLRPPL